MARIGGGPTELRTKSGVKCTAWFPKIADLLTMLPGGPHGIDGEACVLDEIGSCSPPTQLRAQQS
jgi:bifunctional non-homologous end joining protein LigD